MYNPPPPFPRYIYNGYRNCQEVVQKYWKLFLKILDGPLLLWQLVILCQLNRETSKSNNYIKMYNAAGTEVGWIHVNISVRRKISIQKDLHSLAEEQNAFWNAIPSGSTISEGIWGFLGNGEVKKFVLWRKKSFSPWGNVPTHILRPLTTLFPCKLHTAAGIVCRGEGRVASYRLEIWGEGVEPEKVRIWGIEGRNHNGG